MHEGPALCFGPWAPVLYETIPGEQRAARAELTDDVCAIDNEHFFIRGNLNLPIIGNSEHFSWLVWVSLSRQNMQRMLETWGRPGREAVPPYFGWLSTSLPGYPDTVNLKTNVHTCPVGIRPLIELEPTDHPLAREQREGITWERVLEINSLAEHGHKG
jgi:hypothetical protein